MHFSSLRPCAAIAIDQRYRRVRSPIRRQVLDEELSKQPRIKLRLTFQQTDLSPSSHGLPFSFDRRASLRSADDAL